MTKKHNFYQQMESNQFVSSQFCVSLLCSSTFTYCFFSSIWFAERLSKPIGRLAAAAKQVGAGELTTQVIEDQGDDEIAQLGRYFNQMTKQLKSQRDALIDNTDQIEEGRLFDSVLSSVTSGVIVLDPDGNVTFTNNSANNILSFKTEEKIQNKLNKIFPELNFLFQKLKSSKANNIQSEIQLVRSGRLENFLVRMGTMNEDGTLKGYVVFDDITNLVAAQVCCLGRRRRRIAHEIKIL